jgi:hypothetical protein
VAATIPAGIAIASEIATAAADHSAVWISDAVLADLHARGHPLALLGPRFFLGAEH